MKRNKIALAGIALLVAGGLALAGCSSSGSGSPSASGGDSTAIIKTNGSEPENPLIPTNTNEVGGGKILDEIFAGLVYYDAKGAPQNDMAESITTIVPHHLHEIDYQFAIQRAHENGDIVAAVEAYHAHEQEVRFQMERFKSFMKRHRCSIEEARDHYAYIYAKAAEEELAEGHAFMDWMIAEGWRFEQRRSHE